MRKVTKIVYFFLFMVAMVSLVACNQQERSARSLEQTLWECQDEALAREKCVADQIILGGNVDSIRSITEQNDQILFYIYEANRMIYWSTNWLAFGNLDHKPIHQWWFERVDNALIVGRWDFVENYRILTIIPIQYSYQLENRQLHNEFIPPFDAISEKYTLSPVSCNDYEPIYTRDSLFLCSLSPRTASDSILVEMGPLSDSFSFRHLVNEEELSRPPLASPHTRALIYLVVVSVLFIVLIGLGVYCLIRYRGFKRMKMSMRFMYVVVGVLLTSFIYIFILSVQYVRTRYSERQQQTLVQKMRYIQSVLQYYYYSDADLPIGLSEGMSADLKALSETYETDIQVYNMSGMLIASSSPELFNKGLVSRLLSPDVYYVVDHTLIRYEHLGDMQYLVGYTPFYNGAMMQVGYISVPCFVSQMELLKEQGDFLLWLLPSYILVLLIAILFSYSNARAVTRPIEQLASKMKDFQLGKRQDNHLHFDQTPEFEDLVNHYNDLVDQIEVASRQLARSEREEAWRTMARQIAHEINNPLTPMKLTIQQLQRLQGTDRFDAYFSSASAMLIEEINNLSHIASSFSSLAKMPEVVLSQADVAQKLSSVITLLRHNTDNIPIRYVGPDSGVWVTTDPEQITQVFTNILKNALQAIGSKSEGDIIVILNQNYSDKQIEISISDNGPGIPHDMEEKVFLPNFTTKSTGTGLGLAISKNIIESSDGKICFQTSEKGTIFFVYLNKIL